MGFSDDHPKAARLNARLWPALITAVVALAAAGSAPLAATDDPRPGEPAVLPADCPPEVVGDDLDGPLEEEPCRQQGAEGEQAESPGAPGAEQTPPADDEEPAEESPAGESPAGESPEAQPDAPVQGDAAGAAAPAAAPSEPAPGSPADPGTPDPGPPVPASPAPVTPAPATAVGEPARAVAVQRASRRPSGATTRPAARQRRAAVQGRRHAETGERAQVYFPPVSIDWLSLTPLAPPAFGSGEATRFPGPLFLLPIYQAAAVQYRIPWEVLAAINEIETGFGSNTGVSSAGALGWMQFMPATWEDFGVDGNNDGQKNPHDPVDAIFAAARYLRASGAARDLPRAIFAYNHANWYVERVLGRAREIGDLPEDLLATLVARGREQAGSIRRFTGSPGLIDTSRKPRTIGRILLLDDERLRDLVLADARIDIYGCGRRDIAAGVVDRRVLETLAFLATRELRPAVTSLRCGHGYYTSAGSVSEHSFGAAMDIARINDTPILGNQGAGSVTDGTVRALLELRGGLRPHQIISLMSFTNASNALAMGDHDDHIHVGFAPLRDIEGSH